MTALQQPQIITSVTSKRWKVREADTRTVMALKQRLNESELMARLMVIRGVNLESAAQFLHPTLRDQLCDPFHLKDMDKAVTRLVRAINNNEKICFYGDYDVDGATSTALMVRYFQTLGLSAKFYIPDRVKEGYGPNVTAFEQLIANGYKVIVTLDCGTTSFDVIAQAQRGGADVIVIDHHIAEPALPNAFAVVNPNRLDQESPCKTLAAVGVSFLVLVALNQQLRQQGFFKDQTEPNLLSFLDLVALGTVCDVMPLTKLNRVFVSQGLKILAKRQNMGLRALCDVAGLNQMPRAHHLGFMLGPRINAAGRIGCADYGTRLLTSHNEHEILELAQALNRLNEERRAIEKQVLEDAMTQAEQQSGPIIIVHGTDWHQGVIGIVAGRVKERYHRPALAISFDEQGVGKGSGRSITGIDLGTLIHAARQLGLVIGGGGHAMAAGFSLERQQLDAFQLFLTERVQSNHYDLTPSCSFDGYINASALTIDLIESFSQLEPYGQGNPSPKFVIENLTITHVDVVGTHHVRMRLQSVEGIRLKGIVFQCVNTPLGDFLLSKSGQLISVLAAVKIDHWGGNPSINLEIEDVSTASF